MDFALWASPTRPLPAGGAPGVLGLFDCGCPSTALGVTVMHTILGGWETIAFCCVVLASAEGRGVRLQVFAGEPVAHGIDESGRVVGKDVAGGAGRVRVGDDHVGDRWDQRSFGVRCAEQHVRFER
jgi:hypothetical protein